MKTKNKWGMEANFLPCPINGFSENPPTFLTPDRESLQTLAMKQEKDATPTTSVGHFSEHSSQTNEAIKIKGNKI